METQIEAGQTPEEVAVQQLSPAEKQREVEVQRVRSVLEQAKANAIDQALGNFAGIVEEATGPDPKEQRKEEVQRQALDVGEIQAEPMRRQARQVRVADARDVLYERMSPAKRQWRNPHDDEDLARWIRASIVNHHAVMREIELLHRDWFERAPLDLDLPTGDPLIPVPLANVIVLDRQDYSVLRPLVRKWTTPNTSLRIPLSSIAVAEFTAEKNPSGNAGASGPTPRELLLTKVKKRWESSATEEFIADTPFNIVTWFTESVAEAFGALEDNEICNTTGIPASTSFTSSILSGGVRTLTQAGAAFAYEDIVNLHHSCPKPYRARGVFLVNNGALVILDSLVGSDGHPVLRAGTNMPSVRGDVAQSPGNDGMIFGKPVYEVPFGSDRIWFGDPMQYHMLDSPGISMRSDGSVKFDTDEIAFKAIERVDGGMGYGAQAGTMAVSTGP